MAARNDNLTQSSELGVMPSMSAECTPSKHRYDACFNKWFEEYLGLSASSLSSSTSSDKDSSRDSGVSGFFSKSKATSPSGSATERKRLRERLEGECGPLWKEYQSCVLVSAAL